MKNGKVLIDSNSLLVFVLGMIDPKIINSHAKTSIYDESDYHIMLELIDGKLENIIVLPNILTEVDNLLNKSIGNRRYQYISKITELIRITSEKYIESKVVLDSHHSSELGLTDSLILTLGTECEFIITSDSKLADYARSLGKIVVDLVKYKNDKFKN